MLMIHTFQSSSGADSRCAIFQRPVRRLALVSPWSGSNLGNTAILSSVIFNLSRRIPGVQFVGITLSQDETRRRFGIEHFPLIGASRAHHVQSNAGGFKPSRRQNQAAVQIKRWLKRIPLLVKLVKKARTLSQEIVHIFAASRMVRNLDCVLISGGGALDDFWGGPWAHPWNMLKWGILSRIHRVPFLFISVGKSSLGHSTSHLFVRTALRLACYRSYRDLDSKNAVQALIHAPDDPVVPDLAFSYPRPIIQDRQPDTSANGRLVVAFSPIAYCDPRVWPLEDEHLYRRYLQQLAEIVKWLLKEGHQLILFATDSPDLETIKDLAAAVADFPYDPGAILTLPGPFEQTVDGHLQGIGRADLVVASRLHGVILAHLIAVPVLAISFDPKVDAHMAGIGQSDYCMNIDTFMSADFIKRFEKLKNARQLEANHIHSAVRTFQRQVEVQYDRIFGAEGGMRNERPAELDPSDLVAPHAELVKSQPSRTPRCVQ